MPLEFIPNQPIIFEKPIGDFPCLNNDTKTYGQLMQDEDELCIQWKLGACDEPLCEPNMVMDPIGPDELGAWTPSGGFTSPVSSEINFDGNGNPGGGCTQTVLGINQYKVYELSYDVTVFTGDLEYTIIVPGFPSVEVGKITGLGSFKNYIIAKDNYIPLQILLPPTTTAGDTFQLYNLSLRQMTSCWSDDLNSGLVSWSYDFDGVNGKFCASDPTGGNLSNPTAFTTTGNYHGVELTISDCTTGGIEVQLGGVAFGITSGNGTFRYYGVPTVGTDLRLVKIDNFDGCVSQVNVFDYGLITDYKIHFETDGGNVFSADYTGNAFEDRLVFCNKLSDLTWTVNGMPDGALLCELLKTFIYDPCDDVEHESVNYINYKNDGWECTKMVESWNDGFAFGLYFGDIANPDFVLRQRLRFLAFNPVYRNAGEEYLYSSGNTGRSFAQSQKARTAWFDYMDEYAHDCTRTQLLGQKLLVDGYAFYFPTEDYEPEWNERGAYNLAQSRVTLFHEEAIFGSTCGTMANTVCPPQVIPCPAVELTQVIMLVDSLDISILDKTAIDYYDFYWDNAGVYAGGGGATYDLTSGVDRASFAAAIASTIDICFGTTNTSASCTISGDLLSINVVCTGTITIPMPGAAFAITSAGQIPIALPVTFA